MSGGPEAGGDWREEYRKAKAAEKQAIKEKLLQAADGYEEYFINLKKHSKNLMTWRLIPHVRIKLREVVNPETGKPFSNGREFKNLMAALQRKPPNLREIQIALEILGDIHYEFLHRYFPLKIPEQLSRDIANNVVQRWPEVRDKFWRVCRQHLSHSIELEIDRRRQKQRKSRIHIVPLRKPTLRSTQEPAENSPKDLELREESPEKETNEISIENPIEMSTESLQNSASNAK